MSDSIYQVIIRTSRGVPLCVDASPSLIEGDTDGGSPGALALLRRFDRAVLVRCDGEVLQAVGLPPAAAYRLAGEWSALASDVRGAA